MNHLLNDHKNKFHAVKHDALLHYALLNDRICFFHTLETLS